MPVMTKLTRGGRALVLPWDLTTLGMLRTAMAREQGKAFDDVKTFPAGPGYTFTEHHLLVEYPAHEDERVLEIQPGDTYTAWWQPKGVGSF